jgi:hypothetical protein
MPSSLKIARKSVLRFLLLWQKLNPNAANLHKEHMYYMIKLSIVKIQITKKMSLSTTDLYDSVKWIVFLLLLIGEKNGQCHEQHTV